MKWVALEILENRCLLSSAYDLIGLTALRHDLSLSSIDGSGVSVVVIDTGLDTTNPLIAPNYVTGANIATGGNSPTVVDPHGTHVAGIIGSLPDASRGYDGGVAPKVGLIALNVFTKDSSGNVSASNRNIEKALQWVITNRAKYHIVAVNMSLGAGIYTSPNDVQGVVYGDEIQTLQSSGVTIVSAAGNSYGVIQDPSTGQLLNAQFPNSAAPGIISTLDVGAVWDANEGGPYVWGSGSIDLSTQADQVTSFSQRPPTSIGNGIMAPGAIITSTFPGNQLQQEQGTSQAAPMVTGAVALMQDAALTFGGRLLAPAEVRSILLNPLFSDSITDNSPNEAVWVDSNNNGQLDNGEVSSLATTGLNYPRLDIYKAIKQVRAMFTGGSANPSDPNGTLAGAIIGPNLNGSPVDGLQGVLGSDGSVNVGSDDIDMYAFSVSSAGAVTIQTGPDTSNVKNFDSYLRLFDSSGNQLTADDNSAGSGFSKITVSLATGVYYVGVSGAGNTTYNPSTDAGAKAGATGNFVISFSLSNVDPNGLIAGAVNVNLSVAGDTTQTFDGLIGADFGKLVGVSDVDLFKIIAPDNGRLLVDIDTPLPNPYVDSYLRVFDSNGNSLGSNDNSFAVDAQGNQTEVTDGTAFYDYDATSAAIIGHTADAFLIGNVTRGSTYYIGVSDTINRTYDPTTLNGRTTGGTGGYYKIFVTFANNDQNGSLPQADALTIPTAHFNGTLGSDGATDVGDHDVDLYAIRPNKDGILDIRVDSYALSGNSNPANTVLRLFDGYGTVWASSDDANGADPEIKISVPKNRTYYVGVSGFGNGSYDPNVLGSGSPGAVGDYQLNINLLSKALLPTLWDDQIGAASIKSISIGSKITANLGSDDSGLVRGATDVDLYKFIAPSSGPIEIRGKAAGSFGANTFLRVFNSAGTQLAFNDNSAVNTVDSRLQVSVAAGQTYYIGVNGAGATPTAYNPVAGTGATAGSTGDYSLSLDGLFAYVSAGRLRINGGSGNDQINVSLVSGKYRVSKNVSTVSFSATGIKGISIAGGDGNDYIWLTSVTLGVSMDGGAGNDTLKGGNGNDAMTGGSGVDRISAGAGNDFIFANDSLRDFLDGGPGTDSGRYDNIDSFGSIEVRLS
ncbi:MAG TPA: S8 family serine peptidase [Tepidisphaeraceae bacterium]|nr:S8 family serine peptidase [Tepidisphaeraceae bacterium]